ncbi:CARNS1 [Symbiodinium sp. CCMP2592]|nr:CARNS1 [Symbiodinium sp. CCMP2592]
MVLEEHVEMARLDVEVLSSDDGADNALLRGGPNARDCPAIGQAAEAALSRHRFAIKLLFAALGVAILVACLLRADTLPGQPDQQTANAHADVKSETESAYFENSASFLNRVHHIQSEDLARSATRAAAQVVDTRAKHEAKKETVSSIFVVDDGPEDSSDATTVTGTDGANAPVASRTNSSSSEDSNATTSTTTTTAPTTTQVVEPTFTCTTPVMLGNMTAADSKGLAIDDTTFSQCPSLALTKWPNTHNRISSVRLFKAWDSSWDAKYDRKAIWFALREYIWENNIKVLFGTLISCNETADDADWAYVKELMGYIGWYYTMGLAIGNEVELIHKHPSSSPACNARLFQGKYFQNKVDARIQDMDQMEGFSSVPLTTVMGGFVLSGAPFINTPFAGVADFFRYVSGRYGRRWVYTWNVYPYFDPNVQVNPADPAACGRVLYAAQSFAVDGMITTQLRSLRASTQAVTGRWDDVTWLGETGWSFPQATTLHTPMSACPGFSGPENFLKYYQNFMNWDLSLGQGAHPINHVFFFTMRDSINWQMSEYFGLVPDCKSNLCKLH